MRFLFVSRDKFPPFRVDVSVLFGQEIAGRGHSIDWLLQSGDRCDASYQTIWSGCRVWVGATDLGISGFRRLRKHIYSILHDFKMFSLVRRHKYDFIQVRDKFISALLAIIASKASKTKFLYWLSYPIPEADFYAVKMHIARYPFFYFFRGIFTRFLLYRVILPRADHIFVQSEQMKEDISAMGISEEKMTPVPMGVSLEEISNRLTEIGSQVHANGRAVLYLGTLNKVRKMDFLIKVFHKVRHQLPNAKLYIVGGADDPSDEQILKDEAKRLGISHAIIFTGYLPMKEAWRYVSEADVCVSPFYPTPILNSTSPTKLIEYMALGKAVVANNHPEQSLIISESGAGICVPWEENAFSDAIVKLLSQPAIAEEMGQKGRRYVEEYRSYTAIADALENEYFRIIKNMDVISKPHSR